MQIFWLAWPSRRFGWLCKGYPPHDAGVNEGEAEVSHQGDRPVETLEKQDKNWILKTTQNMSHSPFFNIR